MAQLDGFTDGTCTSGPTVDDCIGTADFGPNNGVHYVIGASVASGMWIVDCDAVTGGIQAPDRCGVCYGDGSACLIFEDGFESGGTSVWSSSVP